MIEKMKRIWKKWFGKKNEPMCEETLAIVSEPMATDEKKKLPSLLHRLEEYLFGKYEFRFNVLTEQTERGECLRSCGPAHVEHFLHGSP